MQLIEQGQIPIQNASFIYLIDENNHDKTIPKKWINNNKNEQGKTYFIHILSDSNESALIEYEYKEENNLIDLFADITLKRTWLNKKKIKKSISLEEYFLYDDKIRKHKHWMEVLNLPENVYEEMLFVIKEDVEEYYTERFSDGDYEF